MKKLPCNTSSQSNLFTIKVLTSREMVCKKSDTKMLSPNNSTLANLQSSFFGAKIIFTQSTYASNSLRCLTRGAKCV